MVSLLLTRDCDGACPYCFARDYRSEQGARREMGFEDYREVLAFLARSGVRSFQMAGGEPTRHPLFVEFLDHAIAGGFRPGILSNGLFPGRVREHLGARRRDFDSILFNVNEPETYAPEQWDTLRANLATLAGKALIGTNLWRVGQSLDHVLDLAREFPVVGLRFVFTHQSGRAAGPAAIPYEELPAETERLVALIGRAGRELGIRLVYDCGFTPCLFTDRQLGVLARYNCHLGGCEPTNLAIDPDLRVSHCFNREDEGAVVRLRDFETLEPLAAHFRDMIRRSSEGRFLFAECAFCMERQVGSCSGGCLADRRILGPRGHRPDVSA